MRTVYFSWAAGLAAVVGMAGCESLHRWRERPAEGPTATTTAATYVPYGTGWWGKVMLQEIHTGQIAMRDQPLGYDRPWPTAPATTPEQLPDVITIVPSPPRKIEIVPEEKPEPRELPALPAIAKKADVVPEKEPAPEKIEIKTAPAETDQLKTIAGQVQRFRNTWRLRYAPLDQDDPYGGSVLLEGAGLDRLRDGQQIRVQGVIIPPTDRTSPALYRIRTLEILE